MTHNWLKRFRAPLVEIGVLALLLLGVNLIFFPHDPGLASWAPHPSLFITLLVMTRYGLAAGAVAAGVCATEYLALAALMPDGPSLPALLAPPWSTPVVLLVPTTLILGKLVDRHLRRSAQVREASRDQAAELASAHKQVARLRAINYQLGAKVVNAEATLPVLFEQLKALATFDRAQLGHAALRLLAEVGNVEAASFWDVSAGRLKLRSHIGQAPAAAPRLDAAACRLFDERDVLALDRVAAGAHSGLPLLLGCVRAGANGQVVAYVAIERVPLVSSQRAELLLGLVIEWLSIATGQAAQVARGRREEPRWRAAQ